MKKLLKRLPAPVRYILLVYGSGMLIFLFFRFLLLCLHIEEVKEIPTTIILQSLLMGLRFDAVINGYILLLPAVLFFFFSFFKTKQLLLAKIISAFIVIVYSISFFIHVCDIRWFGHGAARLTVSVLQWTDTPGWMIKFIFQDIYNYPFLVLFVLMIFLFHKLVKKFRMALFTGENREITTAKSISIYLLLFALMFLGIRGRLAIKSPIRWGTAFFSQYNFANQLGLNPVYTMMRSWLDKKENLEVKYHFMDDQVAAKLVRESLGIQNSVEAISPVARKITSTGNPHSYNVVVVLMESMSAKNMSQFGNTGNLTPILNSLFDRSISFTNFYSDGNHTFNGIYSSLYGFHSLPMVHHMKDLAHQQPYTGLPGTLLAQGYQTTFFTTHDDQFDNMAGFLLPNGFEKIISEKDYDRKDVLSTLGVPDHVMFGRVIKEIVEMSKTGKPFFAAMISGSNHEPLVFPENISLKTHSPGMEEQMVEYADWSIGQFLNNASKYSWFDSTIFVFTGDHGGLTDGFDRYLAFHHLPLIIYAPKIYPQPQLINSVGGQADIYATVCGLLNISHTNNSMGIDLMKSRRDFYPFNFDEEMCCVSATNFFTIGHDQEHFYKISDDQKSISLIEKNPHADSMKTFLEASMQTTQKMIEDRKMK
ncbi:LTA synthase family protein [soil metagenome]